MDNIKYVLSFIGNKTDSIEDIDNFCKKYKDNIAYWYVHPPFGDLYSGRKELNYDETPENIFYLRRALATIKKYNIPVQVTFNSINIRDRLISEEHIISDIQKYTNLFGKPQAVITYDKYAETTKQQFPNIELIRTVNEQNSIDINNLSNYDIIVLRGPEIYNFNLIKEIRSKYPKIKIEYLITDAGCVPTCIRECRSCKDRFIQTIKKVGINKILALGIVTKLELYLLLENGYIDYLKIPPSSIKDLNMDLLNKFILESKTENYTLDSLQNEVNFNLNNLNTKYIFDLDLFNEWQQAINIDTIIKFKNDFWSKSDLSIDFNKLIR